MSSTKKKIRLIATEIIFSDFCISYKVESPDSKDLFGVPFCANDISDKGLILNPTLLDSDNNTVVFNVLNVQPHFYADLLDKTMKDFEEYETELKHIYSVGEVVGYIL